MDEMKIRGEISDELINQGIEQYINEEYNALLRPYLVQREGGKKKYKEESAKTEVHNRLKQSYFQ
jgi:hypothetical protein